MKYILNKDIDVLKNELTRSSLVSLPHKIHFMEKQGMTSVSEVEDWMRKTQLEFKALVEELSK